MSAESKAMASGDDAYRRAQDPNRVLHVVVPLALLALLVAIPIVVVTSLSGSGTAESSPERAEQLRKLPVYWKVRAGDTYGLIAQETGLAVDELERFNPTVDPASIVPGQRLKLRAKVPAPPAKRLGAKWWIVRQGQSFGSIAAATGKDIRVLMALNPKIKPSKMQVGMRVRLRR